MRKKLKSVLKTKTSALPPLALKGLVFGGLLLIFNLKGGFFWALLFLVVAFGFYFKGFFQWRKFIFSFVFLLIYSFVVSNFLYNRIYIFLASLIFAAMFSLLLGVKNLVFINRQKIFNFFTAALYFFIVSAFFVADKTNVGNFLFYCLISFVGYYSVFKESLNFSAPDFSANKRNLIAASSAFLVIEAMSVVMFLPIGFINSTALIILFIFILEDLIFYHIRGGLSRQIILNNITVLIIAIIFIFVTAKWNI